MMAEKGGKKKKGSCFLPIIILIVIIIILAFVPVTEKRQEKFLNYRSEISSSGHGNFTLIIPAPIYIEENETIEIEKTKIINGDISIEYMKTKFGHGMLINGTSSSDFRIWHEKIIRNVNYNDNFEIDLDMFSDKPKNRLDSSGHDQGKIWMYYNSSKNITKISVNLSISYVKSYYLSRSILGEFYKGQPPNDLGDGYIYTISEDLINGWSLYNITSSPFIFQ